MSALPRIFIGSSGEGRDIANSVQQNLEHDAECTIWTQGVFGVSSYPVDDLLKAVNDNDFSIFVFSPDDITNIRSNLFVAARDNVILEAGLFMGRHGRGRNFIVAPRDIPDFHVPSDLLGLKFATYDPGRLSANAVAALGTACNEIRAAIRGSMISDKNLTFSVRCNRAGQYFPLKLAIDIRNTTNTPVVITSSFFRPGPSIRADNRAAGNPAKREYEIKLPLPGGNDLNQFHYLLQSNGRVSTWMPLDPSHTDTEVNSAISAAHCGEWHYACNWLGPNPSYRECVEKM